MFHHAYNKETATTGMQHNMRKDCLTEVKKKKKLYIKFIKCEYLEK